jgi:hypothetical protein
MRLGKQLGALTTITAAAVALAAPVHADVDTDFANQLHGYGIYGPRDYNAWLAKITCERLGNGLGTNAEKSAEFLSHNLPRAPAPRRRGNSFPPQSIRTAPSRCRC